MTGLVGNVSIPTYSGTNVAWKGEVAAAEDGAGTFGEVELSPKRLTAYLDISKQFLIQDSASAEEMLKNDIVRALSEKLESTILGNAAGSTTQPAGIFKLITAPTGAAATYAGTVALEQKLDENNATGNYCYIVSPAVKATLRTAAKDSGSGLFTMENDEINGIPVYCTNSCAGAVVGNFEDYVIAQWGGIDLTVDPYTQASNGKVRLVINAYFDAKPRRIESFTGFVPASN
jgi:HK97 family phage major capsid protein